MEMTVLEQGPGVCVPTGPRGDSDADFSGTRPGETLIRKKHLFIITGVVIRDE